MLRTYLYIGGNSTYFSLHSILESYKNENFSLHSILESYKNGNFSSFLNFFFTCEHFVIVKSFDLEFGK